MRCRCDGDQFDAIVAREFGKDCERLVPAPLRLMRINGGGCRDLAGRIHHGHFDARSESPDQAPSWRAPPAGAAVGDHANWWRTPARLPVRPRSTAQPQIDGEMDHDLGAPRPARRLDEPFVAKSSAVEMPKRCMMRNSYGLLPAAGVWVPVGPSGSIVRSRISSFSPRNNAKCGATAVWRALLRNRNSR